MLKNMKSAFKIALGLGSILVLLSIIAVVGIINMGGLYESSRVIAENQYLTAKLTSKMIEKAVDNSHR